MSKPVGHASGRLTGAMALARALYNELDGIYREEELCDKADESLAAAKKAILNAIHGPLRDAGDWQLTADRSGEKEQEKR